MAREYKHSGIEWIGEIPKEWRVELIGNNIKEIKDKNEDSSEDNALQFKMGTIISKKGGDSKYNPESLAAYTMVQEGDIVINGLNLSFDFISQRVGLVREKGVITSTYLTLRPSSLLYSDFVNYLFKAYDNCKAFHGMGRGLRQILSYRELRNQKLIYPSLKEQQKIANYLDKVCGEVDEMIALQEQMIDELKAYKQSVITEAVTKGLNPDAPMKPSGIDWIGDVPEHWNVCRMKNIATGFINGTSITQLPNEESPYAVTRIETISSGNINYKKVGYVPFFEGISKYLLIKGDILISNINSLERVGNSAIYNGEQTLYHGMNLLRVHTNERMIDIYLHFYLRSKAFLEQMKSCCNHAINQVSVSSSTLKNIFVATPPLSEQQSIASYLDTKCAEIDALIAIKQAKIEELKDYKKSVIYEYVTGKKEVV